ncbi:MAG: M23 family metallopeptidase [Clostridia bacterium]|nr:M23 family metallopeptidase [Clostridia bacterium]
MGKREFFEEEKMKKYINVFGITLILSVVVFLTIFVMYNKKMKKESSMSMENLGMIEDIVSNDELEETSFSSDMGVNEATTKGNKNTTNTINKKKVNKVPVEAKITNTTNNTLSNTTANLVDNSFLNTNADSNIVGNETIDGNASEELEFEPPVSGEIIKDFAVDNLIYSNTLEEWTTHSGIDIKAQKTGIVTASEKGTVESIKNDPRYGLTITITHSNGFKTIYSNLLTTEFVNENESVEKGQTIGTVGESASFEIADESHLHFEMYKDGKPVNPTIYLK